MVSTTKFGSPEKLSHTPPKKTSPKDKGPKSIATDSRKQKEVIFVTTASKKKRGLRAKSKAMESKTEKKKSVAIDIHTKYVMTEKP